MILNNPPLSGAVIYEIRSCSYLMRIWINDQPAPLISKSYGNGVDAEAELLNLLEHPIWTILKYA